MEQSDIEKIIKAIEDTIDKRVNGKIDRLEAKIDAQDEKYKPVLQVYSTANNLGRFVKWLSGFMLAGAIVFAYIKGWLI